ncbi:alpha/beta hydrolase [Streptodolium elevatio]
MRTRSTVPSRRVLPRRLATAAAAVALAAAGLAWPSPAAAAPTPPTLPAPVSHGITAGQLVPVAGSAPLYDVTLTTDAIYKRVDPAQPTVTPLRPSIKVRILLPTNYQTNPATPYKTLYLLHGGNGDFDDWSTQGDVASITAAAGFNQIVVMPEGGNAGWYSNWVTGTNGNIAPQWENFHMQQLVPWIDANFNTTGTKAGRYIAGLSMGGYGALRYAGRYNNLFSAAAGFSPGTNIEMPWAQSLIHGSVVQVPLAPTAPGAFIGLYSASTPNLAQYQYPLGWLWGPHQVFGPTEQWDAQNPVKLATAEKYNPYTKLALYSGTDQGDGAIHGSVVDMHNNLKAKGVYPRVCTGSGDHTWPFWKNDLADFLRYVQGQTPATCTTNPGWTLKP